MASSHRRCAAPYSSGAASAAAGPVGRDAQAATDITLKAELLTWSRAKGLFAGIDLTGASISQNTEDTKKFYGAEHSFDQVPAWKGTCARRFKALPADCVEIFPQRSLIRDKSHDTHGPRRPWILSRRRRVTS